MSTVRILIVDDHPAIRIGLFNMLNRRPDFHVVEPAASGKEAIATLHKEPVDIALIDLRMEVMDGFALLESVARTSCSTRCIIFSSYDFDEDIFKAVNLGARGYLTKDTSEDELVTAILRVHSGQQYFTPRISSKLLGRLKRSSLSEREVEILGLLAKGLTNKQIGTALDISSNTVRCHVTNLTRKLEVADRTEAVSIGIYQGIIGEHSTLA
jgi:DNA-binding NarL/FixJ family response regulator